MITTALHAAEIVADADAVLPGTLSPQAAVALWLLLSAACWAGLAALLRDFLAAG